jgi:adenosine deaminase
MRNKFALTLLLIFGINSLLKSQNMDSCFETVRKNQALLNAFMHQMPKGGDLHHHYSGSIYAETYIKYVIDRNFFLNTNTLEVLSKAPDTTKVWCQFSELSRNNTLYTFKEKLIQKWSTKDYNGVSYPSDKQFFETFQAFGVASDNNLDSGLLELKNRALSENVSYLETMFTLIPCNPDTSGLFKYNSQLREQQKQHNSNATQQILAKIHKSLNTRNLGECTKKFNCSLTERHQQLKLDDSTFTIRYQAYMVRVINNPVLTFKDILVAFEAANNNPLLVGVNIVAPEDNEVSMEDYWLHMQMFAYCKSIYPNVKTAMHAGELVVGLVKPEELTWHITSAVKEAKANRIGHGVDIAYEQNCYQLMNYMATNKIPVEINLVSNRFILKVDPINHPFALYRKYKVPVVISTDDAGVLRTDLTQQYVLLAQSFPDLTYNDIKALVYNSITYSFIEETSVKAAVKSQLDKKFKQFETSILSSR